MKYETQQIASCSYLEESQLLKIGEQQAQLPCFISKTGHLISLSRPICSQLLEMTPHVERGIVIIGCPDIAPASVQQKMMIWGLEHGYIFQWMNVQKAAEMFNLLTAEQRLCLVFFIPTLSYAEIL